jgi:hypothetical protein
MTVNVAVDWITVTYPDGVALDAYTPVLVDRLMRGKAERWKHRTGAYGWRAKQVFIGSYDSGRLIVEASGVMAHVAIPVIAAIIPQDGISVARLDAQATVAVPDADRMVKSVIPSRRYKCSLISNLWDTGATLYVGAPSSDRRLRVYNKTAESGEIPADGGEWLRVEVQARDRYADRLYRAYLRGAITGVYLEYVRAMADDVLYRLLRDSVCDLSAPVWDEDDDGQDWVARRARWLRDTIVPALRRLALHSEEGRLLITEAYRDILKGMDDYPGESDSQVHRGEL